MINEQLVPIQKCYVCGSEAQKDSHFCSEECAEYYYQFMANEMLKHHIIQNVMKKEKN